MTRAGGPDRQDDALVLSTPIIASVFGLIFVAELPDKSAIASLVLSTNTALAGCSPESPRPSPCTRCSPSPPGPLAQPSGSITSWCPVLTLRSAPIGQIRVRGPWKVGPGTRPTERPRRERQCPQPRRSASSSNTRRIATWSHDQSDRGECRDRSLETEQRSLAQRAGSDSAIGRREIEANIDIDSQASYDDQREHGPYSEPGRQLCRARSGLVEALRPSA